MGALIMFGFVSLIAIVGGIYFYLEEKNEKEFDIEVKKNNQEVVVRSKVIFK